MSSTVIDTLLVAFLLEALLDHALVCYIRIYHLLDQGISFGATGFH